MLFIISLVIAFAFSYLLRKPLKKHATLFYIGTVIISAVLALVDIKGVPKWADHYVFDLFRRGTLGTALFVVVMDMATFKKGSKAMRAFMPIRGELSILASILCLCHNVFFGLTYFVMMFTEPQHLPTYQMIAGVLSLIMLCIMIPLFIMSFPCIRKKMNGKTWKKIQRTAYIYYGLLYVHITILMLTVALHGKLDYIISVTVYTLVYGYYAVMRLQRSKFAAGIRRFAQLLAIVVGVCVLIYGWTNFVPAYQERQALMADDDEEETVEVETVETTAPNVDETLGEEEATETVIWNDGTYSGKGAGYGGRLLVEVDIVDGKMTDIRVTEQKEDEPYFTNATAIIPTMLEAQTYDVDTISGATSTSDAIKTGVRRALKEAAKSDEGSEPPAETAAPETTEQTTAAVSQWLDGTYSGDGAGYGGKVVIEVDIVNGEIADIRVASHKEDEPYFTKATAIITDMLEQQTYDVDVISGATSTSDAIKTGTRRALKKAKAE